MNTKHKPTKVRPRGKLIHLEAHEPLGTGRYRNYKQPWSDTYLYYYKKRKKIRLGPCIVGRGSLNFDILVDRDCLEDAEKGMNFAYSTGFEQVQGEVDHKMVKTFRDELDELLEAQRIVTAEGYYIWGDENDPIPSVYVPYDYVDRKIVETAIRICLAGRGLPLVRFKWHNQRDFMIPT